MRNDVNKPNVDGNDVRRLSAASSDTSRVKLLISGGNERRRFFHANKRSNAVYVMKSMKPI